jgi:hypothetical protein
MEILVSFPLLNVAPNNILPIFQWTFQCHFFCPWTIFVSSPLWTVLPTTSLSANGDFGVLSSIELCSWQQPYLPLDILVSFPLLIVAPSDSLIRPWTSPCPFLFWTLLPTTALPANGYSCPSPPSNVVPSDSLNYPWIFWWPSLFAPSKEDPCVS